MKREKNKIATFRAYTISHKRRENLYINRLFVIRGLNGVRAIIEHKNVQRDLIQLKIHVYAI